MAQATSSTLWRRARYLLARGGLALLFCLLSLGGSILSVCTLGRTLYRWHGFAIELRLLPARQGQTRLQLIPLGEVRANTHAAPVALVASLQEIQIDQIRKLLFKSPRPEALAGDFERTARADLHNFILRQLLMAAFGGMLAPLLFHNKRARFYLGSGLLSTAGVAVVLGSALTSFNGKAFASPTYTGALKQAPWVIAFAKDAFTKIGALSQKLRAVASNLNTLYGRIEKLPGTLPDEAGTFRVLHVSDIHNNIAALDFIREVATDFKVSLIVDTGDLTDFGSPPETVIVNGIARLPYPYVFVPGNHDSRAVADALKRAHNVTLLDGKTVTVDGLTLLGLPNPASMRAGVGSVDVTPAELAAGSQELLRLVNSLPAPPDIVAIHDPTEAQPLWGRVPLILCGHVHRAYVDIESAPPDAPSNPLPMSLFKTVVCNAGTTGAAGLRYLDKEHGVPFSCAVLTFRSPSPAAAASVSPATSVPAAGGSQPAVTPPATPGPAGRPQLLSIDLITLNGSFDAYSISHYPFDTSSDSTTDSTRTGINPAPDRSPPVTLHAP